MNGSMQFVRDEAERCVREGRRLPVPELAARLNAAGHRTGYGTPNRGGRGTYRLVRATYYRLISDELRAAAGIVARAFIRPHGGYAY